MKCIGIFGMLRDMRGERFPNGPVSDHIRDVEDDMGSKTTMDLLVERDGDVIIVFKNEKQKLQMQFCNSGSRHPGVDRKLREIVELLQEEANPSDTK